MADRYFTVTGMNAELFAWFVSQLVIGTICAHRACAPACLGTVQLTGDVVAVPLPSPHSPAPTRSTCRPWRGCRHRSTRWPCLRLLLRHESWRAA